MRTSSVLLAVLLAIGGAASSPTTFAQTDADLPGTTLTLDPIGSAGVSGLAVLSPRDGGTAANVLAVAAPAGTIAVVHAGSCASIDPTPVGLLGDIGTAGQLSTVIPVPYSTVADGHHVIAFHPGLDLATVLGCGLIPLVRASTDAASPAPGEAPGPTSGTGDRYESIDFGFSIDWVAPWSKLELEPIPGIDAVRLGNGTTGVIIAGDRVADGDARTCVHDWEGRILGTLRDGSIGSLAPVTGPDGKPVGAGDAERAVGAYQFQLLAPDAGGASIIERVDCRHLSADSVVEITIDAPSGSFDSEASGVDQLLTGLSMTGTVAAGSPTPNTPTQSPMIATPAPTPLVTAAPSPTVDAGCTGMDAWVPAALARIDQLKGLADDAAAATNSGMEVYARQLAANSVAVQALLQAQRQGPVPVAVQKVQADLVRMYRILADSYDLLAQAYRTGDAQGLSEGLGKANEAETLSGSVRRAMRDAATPCGITVPSV